MTDIEKAYGDHMIDEAYTSVCEYKKICKEFGIEPSHKEGRYLTLIEQEMQDVIMYEKILQQEGWKVQKEKKNIKISTKADGNTVGVLVEVHLDVEV